MVKMEWSDVKAVPHQKKININKEISDKDNLYSIHNLNSLDYAAWYLQSKVGFKLYIYIAKNQEGYKFALSNVLFCNWAGCGKSAYDSAVEELIEKGYLVEVEDQKNCYEFYEFPRMKEEKLTIYYKKPEPNRRNYTMTI